MPEYFSKSDLENIIKQMNSDKKALGDVITPFLEKFVLEPKEILEVCQIGKFVLRVDTSIELIDKPKPPAPDFIISHDGKRIGLEHTRITTQEAQRLFKLESLLHSAEQIYKTTFIENIHAYFAFKNDEFNYKTNSKNAIAQELSEIARMDYLDKAYILPNYLSKVRTTKHSKVTFGLKENNYQSYILTNEKLESEIRRKEKKIKGYMSDEQNLSGIWLVLLIGSASSASYELSETTIYECESSFERVYLLADFDAKIIRVK